MKKTFAALQMILFLGAAAVIGCSGKTGESDGSEGVQIHAVRGQVVHLPDPAGSDRSLTLAHEAIDEFAGRDGEVTGMDPMTMPFTVAQGVSLDGLAIGDVIEFKLRVDWKAEEPTEITEVKELPAGTQLVFREAKPPQP